tara:strand:+ start:58 stop:165 length:108 start_codon:yes stop_codon:yes gene_type:complete
LPEANTRHRVFFNGKIIKKEAKIISSFCNYKEEEK